MNSDETKGAQRQQVGPTMTSIRQAWSASIVLAVLLSASCTKYESPAGAQPGLPDLAALDARNPSGLTDTTVMGTETLARSVGAFEFETSLYLISGSGMCEWALYRLLPPVGNTPYSVQVELNDPTTDECWIGIGDFAELRWQIQGPYSAGQSFDLSTGNFVSPGGYVYVAVMSSDAHAAQVMELTLTSEGNFPPVASFTATPQSGEPGQLITLDAAASNDPDGSVAKYEWDLDGDGSYELDNGAIPTTQTTLPDPEGSRTVGLRVTDNRGGTGETSLVLTSKDELTWQTTTLDHSGQCWIYNLVELNGRPALAYGVGEGNERPLRFAWSTSPNGASGWDSVEVDSTAYYGASLAVINDHPALAYSYGLGGSSRGLKYAYSASSDGSGVWNKQVLDTGDAVTGQSLALINGNPAIAYTDTSATFYLHYYYSTEADGSDGWSSVGVGAFYASAPRILLAGDGNPAIAFMTESEGELTVMYGRSLTTDGSDEWVFRWIIDTESYDDLQVALIADMPIVAWYDNSPPGFLFMSNCDTIEGDGDWWTRDILAEASHCSLAEIQGLPALSLSQWAGGLQYMENDAPDGWGEWTATVIDNSEPVSSSLCEINGKPAIAYTDLATGDLKYAYAE